MRYIDNPYTDPCFNLAAEEYLLKQSKGAVCMVWQNEPCVVIGKHQSVWHEVNPEFIRRHQIRVVRRFSGGGAVYHDEGNINVTFLEDRHFAAGEKFTHLLLHFLHKAGVNAETDKRQNILINGLKVSGSAQCLHKGRAMHHATLLFSSNLANLTEALQPTAPEEVKASSAGHRQLVGSVKSDVTNICLYIPELVPVEAFRQNLSDYLQGECAPTGITRFDAVELQAIRALQIQKYNTPQWNYEGRSLIG